MEYYYIFSYNGIKTLYRIRRQGRIHENVDSLEAFENGKWSNDAKFINSFMNHYVTGWLDEDDAMDYETAMKLQ
jgi:hypothetical protein